MVGRRVNQVSASCVSARQSLALLLRNVLTASDNTSGDVDVTVLIVRGLSALMRGLDSCLSGSRGGGGRGNWFLVSLRRTTARPASHSRRLVYHVPLLGLPLYCRAAMGCSTPGSAVGLGRVLELWLRWRCHLDSIYGER